MPLHFKGVLKHPMAECEKDIPPALPCHDEKSPLDKKGEHEPFICGPKPNSEVDLIPKSTHNYAGGPGAVSLNPIPDSSLAWITP